MKKILIVDDEVEIVQFLENFFIRKNLQTLTATTAKKSLSLYKTHRPDLVLLDINMPEVDGLKILKEIRDFDKNASVIMITSRDDEHAISSAKLLGVNEYLVKPLELDKLQTIVFKNLFKTYENKL